MALLAFFFFWFFAVGTIFGSFLNVVVWRLPQGMSLSFPASHCPHCQHPIRWRHNIPLLGWWMLRGKCYDCGKPISIRYPLVEFLCGIGFLCPAGLFLMGMETLPFYLYDVTVFMTLLAIGLIEWDGQRVPWKILFPWSIVTFANLFFYFPYVVYFANHLLGEGLLAFPVWLLFLLLGTRYSSHRAVWVCGMVLLLLFPGGLPILWVSSFVWGIVYFSTTSKVIRSAALPWSLILLPVCQWGWFWILFYC